MSNLPTWRTGQAIRTRICKGTPGIAASCRAGRLVIARPDTGTLDDDHHAAAEALARRLGWIGTPESRGFRLFSGTLAGGDGVHLIVRTRRARTTNKAAQ